MKFNRVTLATLKFFSNILYGNIKKEWTQITPFFPANLWDDLVKPFGSLRHNLGLEYTLSSKLINPVLTSSLINCKKVHLAKPCHKSFEN